MTTAVQTTAVQTTAVQTTAVETTAVETAQNGAAASDTAVAQISDTVAAGLSRTSPVAGYLVTLTIETWTVFVQIACRHDPGSVRRVRRGSQERHRADGGRRPPGRPVPRRPHCLRLNRRRTYSAGAFGRAANPCGSPPLFDASTARDVLDRPRDRCPPVGGDRWQGGWPWDPSGEVGGVGRAGHSGRMHGVVAVMASAGGRVRGCRPGFRDLLAGGGQLGRRPPDGRADVVGQGWDQHGPDDEVSSSTPNATAKPRSARNTSGSTPRTVKVAASTTPAEVITPPVTAGPRRIPGRVPKCTDSSRTRVIRNMLSSMPGATRNTNANNGNGPGRRPANPDRWVNAHPHTRRGGGVRHHRPAPYRGARRPRRRRAGRRAVRGHGGRARRVGARPEPDHPDRADRHLPGADRAAARPARAVAADRHRGVLLRRHPRGVRVGVHPRVRVRRRRPVVPVVRVRVPGRAGHRLQHLPDDPGPGGIAAASAPAPGSCADWR